jgi:hypothetical protein
MSTRLVMLVRRDSKCGRSQNQGLISLPEGGLLGSATGRQPPERRALRPGPDRKFVGMREELA